MQTTNDLLTSKLPGIGTSIFAIMSGLAAKEGAVNLSQGFPDFDCPPQLVELVHKYMKEGKNQYAPMPGILPLRERISAKAKKLYNATYNPETEITITSGATQALYAAISAVVSEGDEVVIFEPAYDSYAPAVLLNKGISKYVQLNPPDYRINWDEVKKQISYRTKLIILNTPHNPTGTVLSADDMKQLEKIVSGTDIIILSDEVYEHITFDGHPHESICKYPALAQRSIVVYSFGKTYHNTGWKMGYALAPEPLMTEFRKVYQFMMFAANTPIQFALADFMENEEHYLSLNSFYEKKRDIFSSFVNQSRFKLITCEGTYFQCIDYSDISNEKDTDMAIRLTKEHKLATIPVSVFYNKKTDHKILRVCFAKSEETLKKAGEILCRI